MSSIRRISHHPPFPLSHPSIALQDGPNAYPNPYQAEQSAATVATMALQDEFDAVMPGHLANKALKKAEYEAGKWEMTNRKLGVAVDREL